MNHVFCTECGNKIGFLHAKPNFCSKCGATTGVGLKTKTFATKKKEEVLGEDETSIDEVPYVDKLAVDIEQDRNNIFSFASLAGKEDKESRSRNKGSKNIEDFIDDKRRR